MNDTRTEHADVTDDLDQAAAVVPSDAGTAPHARLTQLAERGLTTVEYAIGIVLILSIVGLLIRASTQGWFLDLVKALVGTIFQVITNGILG